MFISVSRSGKDGKNAYVNLMETYRDADGKKRARLVESYGKLDDLLADDPDALNKLKARCAADRQRRKEEKAGLRKVKFQKLLETAANAANGTAGVVLNYSYYCLRSIWHSYFALDRKINYMQKTRLQCTHSINDTILYLDMHAILSPGSVQSAFADKDNFLGDPIRNVSLEQLYDACAFADTYKDDILTHLNRNLDRKLGGDRASLIWYDVTDACLEAQCADSERNHEIINFIDAVKNKAVSELEQKRLDPACLDEDGDPVPENLPQWFWDEMTSDECRHMGSRGPSRGHRPGQPHVSTALVVDRQGYPLDFEIHTEDASECRTVQESIASLRKKYGTLEAVVAADRGVNSLSDIQTLAANDLGFLVYQDVSQLSSELDDKMFDLNLYRPIDISNPASGLFLTVNDWEGTESPSGSDIPCTLVLTYHEKRKHIDDAILDIWAEIIEQKKHAGESVGPEKPGWASLAETDSENVIIGVDKKVLERARKRCGFAAMVYQEPPKRDNSSAVGMSGDSIAGIHHQLKEIAACFRTMKSCPGLRPASARTSSHVRGHVAICLLALLMMRILQEKLRSDNIYASIRRICSELGNASVAAVAGGQCMSYVSLHGKASYRRGHESKSTDEIIHCIASGSIPASCTDDIMRACGLTPLPAVCDRNTLAACLGTRFREDRDAVPAVHMRTKSGGH